MKNVKFIIAILLGICILGFSNEAFAREKSKVKFKETVYDFGTVKEDGGRITHEFTFVNEGPGNLLILDAKADCGCTVPQFSDAPVAPGKEGKIKVTFNPLGRPGGFTKVIRVKTNGEPGKINLKIRGSVMPKK